MITVGEHLPRRPKWDCLACLQPWPCDPAREQLAQELNPVALSTFAGERMVEAADDMRDVTPQELFERFLAWTRRPPP